VSSALIRGYKLDAEAAGLSLIFRLLPSKLYRSLGRRLYNPPELVVLCHMYRSHFYVKCNALFTSSLGEYKVPG